MGRFGFRGRRKGIPNEPALLAAAAENPGGSVAEIDPAYIEDPNGYVPPEAIRGAWLVDSTGKPTGEYQKNPRHGVPQDDFSHLTGPDHWLGWLGRRSDDEQIMLVTRAALAAPFALSVRTAQYGRSTLLGVFSWAAVNLLPPEARKDRHWFDLGVGLDWADERLPERIYEIDAEGGTAER
ncbi:hypothetical protein [Streptomyces lavendulae]|uniref:hypothetical protein n=1 Tax=Streptomyces lavendulae TaxID=1914 RepID=UPI0036C9AC5C